MERRAADFVYAFTKNCEGATSLKELEALLFEAAEKLGFSHVACGAHADPAKPPEGAFFVHNYPDAWADRFTRKRYHLIDPVLRHAESVRRPFEWDDPAFLASLSERQRRVLSEARHFRIAHGLTIPLRHEVYLPASCTFVSETGDIDALSAFTARTLAMLFYCHASLLAREGRVHEASVRLTRRERECMDMKAAGLSDDEIAKRLDLSISTVCRHIEQAKLRLGARTREEAVARAIETRQIR